MLRVMDVELFASTKQRPFGCTTLLAMHADLCDRV